MTQTSPSSPDNAGVIAPPPLIAAATIVIGLMLDWLLPIDGLASMLKWRTRLIAGGVPFAAGAVLAIVAVRTFRRLGTNVPPWEPTLKLVTTGLYEWIRNPMYLGLGLMLVGVAIALASDWTLLVLIPAALVLHYGVVLREEHYLEARFDDGYRRYRRAVPRYGWPF